MPPEGPATAPDRSARRFLGRLALFGLPLLLYASGIVIVDPYDFLSVSHMVPDSLKDQTAGKLNYRLWKMLRYRRAPRADILLGDSRMLSVTPAAIREVCGMDYYNFAYGAGSVPEMISTFWFADSTIRLNSVVMGINFNMYNGISNDDRTADYRDLERNPGLYFVNHTVLRAAVTCIRAMASGAVPAIEQPPMDHEQFWRFQLQVTARSAFRRYRYPAEFRSELQRVAEHCRRRGIRLVFVVFPTHADLRARVADFGLLAAQERFRRDLREIAPVYDFDRRTDFTQDRADFSDPFHFREPVMRRIVAEVWGPPLSARSATAGPHRSGSSLP
jgi:hypothetical protein